MDKDYQIKELKLQLGKLEAEKDFYKNQLEHYKTEKVFSKLENSEERFRLLAESAPVGIVIADNNDDTLFISPRFTEITGYTLADIPTLKNWWSLAYPDEEYRSFVINEWANSFSQEDDDKSIVKPKEFLVTCKNGTSKHIEFRATSVNENNYVIITDVTERVAAEYKANERLKELKSFYKLTELTETKGINQDDIFSRFVEMLPDSLQYPEVAYARIAVNDFDFRTDNYIENGKKVFKSAVKIDGKISGVIEVGYIPDKPDANEGAFLKEERQLIDGIAERVGRIVERMGAEESLLYQIRFQKMVAEISSDFIRVNDANIDAMVQSMLERLGHFFQVDRTYLFFFENNYKIINNTHEWCSKGTKSVMKSMQNFNADIIPWWKNQILHEKSICITDAEKLPKEADAEKEIFRQQDIKSLLSVPVITHEGIIGFFGFDAVKRNINWDKYQVEFLKVIANILADAYVKVESEEKLKKSEAQYRVMFETAQEGIVIAQDYRLAYFNPIIREFTGYSNEELQDMEFVKIIHPDDRDLVFEKYKQRLKGEDVEYQYEFRLLAKGGSVRWVTMSGVKLMWNGWPATFNFLIDITRQKETLEKLKELNATKDKFFSIISHDLKSPFNSILGMSDMLVESAGEEDMKNVRHYANVIRDSSERAMELLTNLLDWTRAQTGRMAYNPEKIDISTVVNDAASLLYESARQKSINLINKIPAHTYVHGDKVMLSTVLRNLMANAIKFSHPHGEVIVSSSTKEDKTVFSISDEGVGMSPGMAKKLFRIDENVSTTGTNNEKGTGLGLILCKELVDKHGGEIWVESDSNKGSTFFFTV